MNQVFFVILSLSIWLIEARQDAFSVLPELKTCGVVCSGIITSPPMITMGAIVSGAYAWNSITNKEVILRYRRLVVWEDIFFLSDKMRSQESTLISKRNEIGRFDFQAINSSGLDKKISDRGLQAIDELMGEAESFLEKANQLNELSAQFETIENELLRVKRKRNLSLCAFAGFVYMGFLNFFARK